MTQPDCPLDGACPPPCEAVFDRVIVSQLVRGMTRVMWALLPTFTDPGPLTFQLQVGRTANPDADDWVDVGLPVVDQFFAHDPEQRAFGKTDFTHYRVVLTTPRGTYESGPVAGTGVLDRRSWRIAREIVRQRLVAYRVGPGGQRGYLLKRRWTGTPCRVCLDAQTREVRDPDCPSCYGTGFECGYFYPLACTYAELTPTAHHTQLKPERGTVDDVVVKAEMVMTELLAEEDVWVAAKTDKRYYVHEVEGTAEVRGQPVVARVGLRLVPFTAAVYGIEIPQQLAELGLGG